MLHNMQPLCHAVLLLTHSSATDSVLSCECSCCDAALFSPAGILCFSRGPDAKCPDEQCHNDVHCIEIMPCQ